MASLLNLSGSCLLVNKKGLLPSGYRQVEYIENTSTAYINPNVFRQDKLDIDCVFSVSATGNYYALFGASDFLVETYSWTRRLNIVLGTSYVQTEYTTVLYPYNMHVHYWNGDMSIVIDNFFSYNNSNNVPSQTLPFVIFASNKKNTGIGDYGFYRIYKFIIKIDNVPVRNFIPCISPNNVVGMYDLVERNFYSSPNGAAFIAGPEV